MTALGRLDHLEDGLPPREATLAWLEEAHGHGSLVAYTSWLVDRPFDEAPLVRNRQQALTAAQRATRGKPIDDTFDAEQQAVRDVAFYFELVTTLDTTALETISTGGLRYGMLFWEMRAISAEARDEDPNDPYRSRPTIDERRANWRATVTSMLDGLRIQHDAFGQLEGRYLDGRVARFPETVARWALLTEAFEGLASLWDDLTSGPAAQAGRDPASDRGSDDPEVRTLALAKADRLLDWVRAQALDIMGDIHGATDLIAPRLRAS